MRDCDRRYERAEIRSVVHRDERQLDQQIGQCPHVAPGEPPCPGCFFEVEDAE